MIGDDFTYITIEIPEDAGDWVNVGVFGMESMEGWVSAVDVGSELPVEVKEAREEAEFEALMVAIDRLQTEPCETSLYFTKIFGTWYLKATETSAIAVDRWLGATDASYRMLQLVDEVGGGRDVPLSTILRVTGEC